MALHNSIGDLWDYVKVFLGGPVPYTKFWVRAAWDEEEEGGYNIRAHCIVYYSGEFWACILVRHKGPK